MTTAEQSREKIGAFDLRVWRFGSGAPILYLHGFEQHPGSAPFLGRLADNHEVRAPEHPGFGSSTGLEHLQDVIDIVLLYRSFVERWGKGPVDVIGHSLGGMFAAELAALAPQVVRKLVLINPFGLWLDEHPAPDPFTMLPKVLTKAKWHDAANAATEPSAFDAAGDDSAATFRSINLAAATKFLWPLPDRGTRRRLPYVTAPTVIVHGEADQLVPAAYAQAWAAAIPGAQLASIANAGHLPMVEAEDKVVRTILDFLA